MKNYKDVAEDIVNSLTLQINDRDNHTWYGCFLYIGKYIVTLETDGKKSDDVPVGLLYLLCFIFPFIAVGIVTDWDITAVIVNILWTFLCGIPGIIHALIIVGRNT